MSNINEFEEIVPIKVESIDDVDFPIWKNMVFVKQIVTNNKTTGGIISTEQVHAWSYGKHSNRVVEVVRVPPKIVTHPEVQLWDCDMELMVGDKAYVTFDDALHAVQFEVNEEIYKAIPYSSFVLAIRGEDVIPVNGRVLIEQERKTLKFGEFEKLEDIDVRKPFWGKVVYVGKRNKSYIVNETETEKKKYQTPRKREDCRREINKGDRVYVTEGYRAWNLEEWEYAQMNDRKTLRVVQRHQIGCVE